MDFRFSRGPRGERKERPPEMRSKCAPGDPEGEMNQARPSCRTYIRLTLDLPFGMLTISYVKGGGVKTNKSVSLENRENIFRDYKRGEMSWRQS